MIRLIKRNNFLNNFKAKKFEKYYDIVVIGGGSGGLSFAKEFKNEKKLKIALFDYVTPSSNGNQWGIGGTCVNVGCIPKKLYHIAGIYNKELQNYKNFGIEKVNDNKELNLEILQNNVKNHINSLNFSYKNMLNKNNIDYINKLITFKDNNKILYGNHKEINEYNLNKNINSLEEIEFDKAIIATGTRPYILSESELPGAKHCITSDDIFFIKKLPKKVLIIGAGYIGLECASFLKEFNVNVTVLARSTCLSSFDKQSSQIIYENLLNKGINLNLFSKPKKIIKNSNNDFTVEYEYQNKNYKENFDLVIMATKRDSNIKNLNLENCFKNIKINKKNNKLIGNFDNTIQSKIEKNLFAIGDILDGYHELTPLAIKMGKNLSNYLSNKKFINFDNNKIPTTIFTNPEYSVVGLSEEESIKKYGKDNIIIYQGLFEQLEFVLNENKETSFLKLICLKKDEKVLGIHFIGKNAGEIMQGYSIAFNKGIHKKDLEDNVGIHPTAAEGIVYVNKIKKDDEKLELESC